MTAKADAAAIVMTANGIKLSTTAGASVAQLQTNLLLKLTECRQLVAIIQSLTPSGDANMSALAAILAELA